jgi:hypothetical protein
MNPLLIAELINYLALVPQAISLVQSTIDAVQKLQDGGRVPTQEELAALADSVRADFEALPKPE